jgi:p-methyltransferase
LAYTGDGKNFQFTRRAIESNEIDQTAVNWDYFERDFFTPTVQIRTARSCAFSCAFCKYPAMAGPLNLASLEVIEQQLRYLDSAGVKNLVFIDDTFNVPLPRFKEICRLMIRNKFSFDWFSFFRCSNSDEEAFDLMARSRCKAVFLGIESGDPGVLKKMNKFADVNRYKQGIRMLKERDITTFASIIVGFPGETEGSVRNTIDFLGETSPTFYRAELYYHYTNVPIHQQADHLGIRGAGYSWKHNTMDWREAADHVKVMLKTIQGPTILPGYMFDFWSIPYLLGKNLSFDQIKGFTDICHQMVVADLDGANDSGRYEEALVSQFYPA